MDQPVAFDPFCSDMLGIGGDVLLGGCGAGDVLLDYPRPGDAFLKGYGLLGNDQSLLGDDQSNDKPSGSVPKKPRLSLKLNRKSKPAPLSDTTNTLGTSRFAEPVTDEYSEKAAKGVIPDTTEFNTRWAMKNFESWVKQRNERLPDDPVPLDLLESNDADEICKIMCLFVLETRREDGKPYPPATIRSLLSGLNRMLRANKAPFSILDKGDSRFRPLLNTMDTISSDLHREGIGAERKSAGVITPEDEDKMWEDGALGLSPPKVLQHTVFFYMGLHFLLRGVQEQHMLVPAQLVREPCDTAVYHSTVYYRYTEFISKNNQHRFKDINLQNKVVRTFAQPDSSRCVVKLLDLYLSHLPKDAPFLYMRPVDKAPTDGKPWFVNQRVGVNTLKSFVPRICGVAGFPKRYTNHSLRATGITRMFSAGVPEKIIAEKSGHRSLKALRFYEHTSDEQEMAAGEVIGESKKQFSDVMDSSKAKTEPEPEEKKPNMSAGSAHHFSGNLTNCTINITYKQ